MSKAKRPVKSKKKARRRRLWTAHPGVKLKSRNRRGGGLSWRAIYVEPETGETKYVTLDHLGITTVEARTEWAIHKSQNLARRRAVVKSAGALPDPVAVDEGIESFLSGSEGHLRPRTIESYRMSLGIFRRWAEVQDLDRLLRLTPVLLANFRQDLVSGRYTRRARTGKRQKDPTSPARGHTPWHYNHVLRAVASFLRAERRLGRTPHLTGDAISESLKQLPVPRVRPHPLKPGECGALLRAAMAHDAATFKATREERVECTTPRHRSVAPFVAFLLLSGCRFGEAQTLTWDSVDLDAPDETGGPVGEVTLQATATKTHAERRIDLSVSPALRTLLAALKLRAGQAKYVFGDAEPLGREVFEKARRRLSGKYGAPKFTWQRLRQTTASYLTNAPGIFAAASIYRSAAQLGHSPEVATKHYVGIMRGIPREARTLEQAMGIVAELGEIVSGTSKPPEAPTLAAAG